jgi:hypothetical protein
MKKYWFLALIVAISVLPCLGCCPSTKNSTSFFDCTYEKVYYVSGRVLGMDQIPIENCKIVLIKRNAKTAEYVSHDADVTASREFPVYWSDKAGEFSLMFEPLGDNDIWLYLDAEDQGYEPRYVYLSPMMGRTLFEYPGFNPLHLDLVLEKVASQ